MNTWILAFALMACLMLAMAVGVIFTGRRLQGSCGGEGGADCICDAEGRPRECEKNGHEHDHHHDHGGHHDHSSGDATPGNDYVALGALGRRKRTES